MAPQSRGGREEGFGPRGGGERYLANIAAYLSDSRYFLGKGDLIRAFEAVVWAWAWIEIGEDAGFLILERDPPS